jgi:hypothetical protein
MDEQTRSFALKAAVIVVTTVPLVQQILDFSAKVLLHDKDYRGDDKILFACVGAVLTIIYAHFKKK